MRLFTFGCSFTKFEWPTWADILARHYEHHSNWAKLGAGNHFIFNSLMESLQREKITKDDTVCIMWSSIAREDRYVNNQWLLSGSIYSQKIYDQKFVDQFADPTGYLLRDLSYISAAKQVLDSIGCQYHFYSIVPLSYHDDFLERFFSIDKRIERLYNKDMSVIHPSVYEVVFKNDWYSRVGYRDWRTLEKNYYECRGANWPKTWEEFLNLYQNKKLGAIENEILDRFEFRKKLIRTDYHPTPYEHLLYLESVFPSIIDDDDREYVDKVNRQVLMQTWTKNHHNKLSPVRF